MAWHWRALGRPFQLLTRVGREDGGPIDGVPGPTRDRDRRRRGELARRGRSSTIDIEILADRQPYMDNFVGGVWDDYRLTRTRSATRCGRAKRLHVVLVEGAIAELARLAADGALRGIDGLRGLPRLPPLHRRAPRGDDAPRRPRVHRLAGRRGRRDGRGHARRRARPGPRARRHDGRPRRPRSSTGGPAPSAARAPLSRCEAVEVAGHHARLRRRVHRLVPGRAVAHAATSTPPSRAA